MKLELILAVAFAIAFFFPPALMWVIHEVICWRKPPRKMGKRQYYVTYDDPKKLFVVHDWMGNVCYQHESIRKCEDWIDVLENLDSQQNSVDAVKNT